MPLAGVFIALEAMKIIVNLRGKPDDRTHPQPPPQMP